MCFCCSSKIDNRSRQPGYAMARQRRCMPRSPFVARVTHAFVQRQREHRTDVTEPANATAAVRVSSEETRWLAPWICASAQPQQQWALDRRNLERYHGILAPNARHRSRVVPATPGRRRRSHAQARAQALGNAHREGDQHRPTAPMTADCVEISIPFAMRTDAIDLSACPQCGGRLRVIAGADFRMSRDRM